MIVEFMVSLAISLVMSALSAALTPRAKGTKPTQYALSDFDAPTAEDGKPLCVVFGSRWITGANVLWYGDLKSVAIKKKGGGKK